MRGHIARAANETLQLGNGPITELHAVQHPLHRGSVFVLSNVFAIALDTWRILAHHCLRYYCYAVIRGVKTLTMTARKADFDIRHYKHDATRKNNPPAAIAGEGRLPEADKTRYAYDPHLPPVLRFDDTGAADRLPQLIEAATQRKLAPDEAQQLYEALSNHEPWLEWTGKREQSRWFEVDPVALHTHERVSAQAAVRVATRKDVQRDLFADPQQPYHEAVQFYQHEVDWANRMILGDSLTVMNSLATRENLAGKVQMVYMDPPYGIKFGSNFQPHVRLANSGVGDRDTDLTREPEVVKAYRDTWELGVHSYLTYLRDRLIVARDLLKEEGSIFLQIGDANFHRIRTLLEEVFGSQNFVAAIPFSKTVGKGSAKLDTVNDYLMWFARNKDVMKYRQLYFPKELGGERAKSYVWIESEDTSHRRRLTRSEQQERRIPHGHRLFSVQNMTSQGSGASLRYPVRFNGVEVVLSKNQWKTNPKGMERLKAANRLTLNGKSLNYVRYQSDSPFIPLNNVWTDTAIAGYSGEEKVYVVQTPRKVVSRCLLMTTDPGDLIVDPTCGGGTTALVAEQWGRRWITMDTSRVSIAIARRNLLTASFDFYETGNGSDVIGPSGFRVKTAPSIKLSDISQNMALDPIFARWDPIMDAKLEFANEALLATDGDTRAKLFAKLERKRTGRGRESRVTDADERRWKLPSGKWEHWEVPFDTDDDYPDELREAVEDYRVTWRKRMQEVNACIGANADQEVLVDQPEIRRGVVRVSGPFTVESVHPPEDSIGVESPIGGAPDDFTVESRDEPSNAEASIDSLVDLLRVDGVRFPDNKEMRFARLEVLKDGSLLNAEGEWHNGHGDASRHVAVSFGPQYGPVTAKQVEDALRLAVRLGYDELLFAGFGFDGAAQTAIRSDPNPNVRLHMAHISPDVNMGDLLKQTRDSQLFSVSGAPRTEMVLVDDGRYVVEMEGVDIYDPLSNSIRSAGGDSVPAWFLDSDYDGRTFCITQAFFPRQDAWKDLARDLKKVIEADTFETFKGTTSLPFQAGEHRRVAVKVIDPRGNEVMSVLEISEDGNG